MRSPPSCSSNPRLSWAICPSAPSRCGLSILLFHAKLQRYQDPRRSSWQSRRRVHQSRVRGCVDQAGGIGGPLESKLRTATSFFLLPSSVLPVLSCVCVTMGAYISSIDQSDYPVLDGAATSTNAGWTLGPLFVVSRPANAPSLLPILTPLLSACRDGS